MKFELMFRLFYYLLGRDAATAAEIAEKLEVSVRSVFRYAEALNAAGIPVLCRRGARGGLYIPDTFKVSASYFTEEEIAATLAAFDRMESDRYREAVHSAKEKLLGLRRGEHKRGSGDGYVIVDGAPWGDSYGFRATLDVILRAIEERRVLRIRYHDRDGNETDRDTEPHYLLLKQGLAYLYAFCRLRGEFRFFKLGRIAHATLLYDNFERREVTVPTGGADFPEQAKSIEIELAVDRSARSDVEEWLGVSNVTVRKDGEIRATAILPDDRTLTANLLRFGSAVRVLSPLSVVKKLRDELGRLADFYQRAAPTE